MGRYINNIGNTYNEKINSLIADGARIVDGENFQENLVCVVNNGHFAAAAYAYDEREYKHFTDPSDPRRKTWLVYHKANQLAI